MAVSEFADTVTIMRDSKKGNDLMVAKIVAMTVLGLVSFILGVLPVRVASWFHIGDGSIAGKKQRLQEKVISLLLCFGAGVLLYTTFMHLQPEVREGFRALENENKIPSSEETGIALAEIVFCAGFFLVYLVEEVVHLILDHRHQHHQEEVVVLHRSMSVRRCSARHPMEACDHNHTNNIGGPNTIIPRAILNPGAPTKGVEGQTGTIPVDPLKNDCKVKCLFSSTEGLLNSGHHLGSTASSLDVTVRDGDFNKKAHGHSHLGPFGSDGDSVGVSKVVVNSFRGLLTVLALSFHAIFEGLAVGLESSVSNVWYLFGAVACHKFVIALCVGVELVSSKTRPALVFLYVATFAAVTPIGIGAGLALSHSGKTGAGYDSAVGIASVVLQGMAAGTLLYVVFFEILQRERSGEHSGLCQLLAVMAGFAVMFGLTMSMGHHHEHPDGVTTQLPHHASHYHDHDHDHDHDHHDHSSHVVTTSLPTTSSLLQKLLSSTTQL